MNNQKIIRRTKDLKNAEAKARRQKIIDAKKNKVVKVELSDIDQENIGKTKFF
jgi:hypothetical protein